MIESDLVTSRATIAELRTRLAAGRPQPGDLEAVVVMIDTLLAGIAQAQEAGELRRAGVAARDRELRRLAERHLADLKPRPQAERIAGLWRTYSSTGWLRDRRCATLPDHLRGRPEEHLWHTMLVWKPVTLGWRQILTILQTTDSKSVQ